MTLRAIINAMRVEYTNTTWDEIVADFGWKAGVTVLEVQYLSLISLNVVSPRFMWISREAF